MVHVERIIPDRMISDAWFSKKESILLENRAYWKEKGAKDKLGVLNEHLRRYLFAKEQFSIAQIVIDAGCGCGYGSEILASKVKKVIAVDISNEAVNYARYRYQHNNIDYVEEDVLKFNPLPIDGVVCFEVLEHIKEDPQKLIDKIHNDWLKGAGKLIVSVPIFEFDDNPYHVRHFKPTDFEKLLKKFKNVKFFYQDSTGNISQKVSNHIMIAICEKELKRAM